MAYVLSVARQIMLATKLPQQDYRTKKNTLSITSILGKRTRREIAGALFSLQVLKLIQIGYFWDKLDLLFIYFFARNFCISYGGQDYTPDHYGKGIKWSHWPFYPTKNLLKYFAYHLEIQNDIHDKHASLFFLIHV